MSTYAYITVESETMNQRFQTKTEKEFLNVVSILRYFLANPDGLYPIDGIRVILEFE